MSFSPETDSLFVITESSPRLTTMLLTPICEPCYRIFKTTAGLTKHLIAYHNTPPDIALLMQRLPEEELQENTLHLPNLDTEDIENTDTLTNEEDSSEGDAGENNDSYSESSSSEHDDTETNFDAESDVMEHPGAGYIISGANAFDLNGYDISSNAKYYPWANADELWLTNFIFGQAKISSRIANTMLEMFAAGRIRMENPIRFSNVRQMYRIMDRATYSSVSLNTIITIIFQGYRMINNIFCDLTALQTPSHLSGHRLSHQELGWSSSLMAPGSHRSDPEPIWQSDF